MNLMESDKTEDIKRISRKSMQLEIPVFGYKFEVIQLRRYWNEEDCIMVQILEDGSFKVLKRYKRHDEPDVIEELTKQLFLSLGIRPPKMSWGNEVD